MPKYENLPRAPITEAVLDLVVPGTPGDPLDKVRAFAPAVPARYGQPEEVRVWEAIVGFRPGAVEQGHRQNVVGMIWWNEEHTRAVQARVTGFSVNHLKPYGSGDEMIATAKELWPLYAAEVSPERVTQASLRYINRIELPDGADFDNHFQTFVRLGPQLPQSLGNFLLRAEVPFDEGRRALITLTLSTPVDGKLAVIMDITAVSKRDMGPSDPALWTEVEALREIKNICFFESLTPITWRQYK
jgi:uncharacterized protein (TIGR04255 family)